MYQTKERSYTIKHWGGEVKTDIDLYNILSGLLENNILYNEADIFER